MDNAHLLVLDRSPGSAEEINSLLRNSGINIHTLFADNLADAEHLIREHSPFLVIFNDTAAPDIPIANLCELASRHQFNLAVRFKPANPEMLLEALSAYSCLAINAQDNDQLTAVVQRQLAMGSNAREYDDIRQHASELQDRFNLLLDSAGDAIAYVHEGLHVYANTAYLEAVQVGTCAELASVSLLDIVSSDTLDMKKFIRDLGNGVIPAEPVSVTVRNPAGVQFQANLAFSPARFNSEDCIQMILQRDDGQAALKDELKRLKHMDPLTGLPNRRAFCDDLATRIAQKFNGMSGALFYVEPDDVQDLFLDLGASGMDDLILKMSKRLRDQLESQELISRFGDHGFCILALREDRAHLHALGEQLKTTVGAGEYDIDDHLLTLTCSIGHTLLGGHSRNAIEAVSQARLAFEDAALQGDSVVQYKPALGMARNRGEDENWLERIGFALNNNDLYSVRQTIVNLDGDSEGLFENRTYLREEGADRRPEDFMPMAERHDLASTIDRQVIPGLLSAIAGSGDRHIINVSSNSVLDFSFPGWFQRQLEELDVQGSQIILQLSAQAAYDNLKSTRRLFHEIAPLGCAFSLSSFDDQRRTSKLLKKLDVSMVKLRSGLTENLSNNTRHQEIIRNVVKAAERVNAVVVADGVADTRDMAVLWQCGVKLVAGEFLEETPQVVGQ